MVGDGLSEAGEGLHLIGETSGGKLLCLEVLIACFFMLYFDSLESRAGSHHAPGLE